MWTAGGLKAVLAVATPLLALATANSASTGARAPVSSMLHNAAAAAAAHPRVDAVHAAAQEEPLISAGAEVAAGGAGEAVVAVTGGQAVEQVGLAIVGSIARVAVMCSSCWISYINTPVRSCLLCASADLPMVTVVYSSTAVVHAIHHRATFANALCSLSTATLNTIACSRWPAPLAIKCT